MIDKKDLFSVIIVRFPAVIPHLGAWFYKTYDYYLATIQNLVRNLYDGYIGGEFRDILSNLVLGQLSQAFEQAARDNGVLELNQDMFNRLMDMVTSERLHIEDFYRAVVDARVDKTGIEPLLVRADLWARRWQDAYNEATRMIEAERGGKLVWRLGATEQHCTTCAALNNLVAFASEWEQARLRPQSPPNGALECGGWRCDCVLEPTDRRRSPDVLARLFDIAAAGGL